MHCVGEKFFHMSDFVALLLADELPNALSLPEKHDEEHLNELDAYLEKEIASLQASHSTLDQSDRHPLWNSRPRTLLGSMPSTGN
jgi:hypothetical protein